MLPSVTFTRRASTLLVCGLLALAGFGCRAASRSTPPTTEPPTPPPVDDGTPRIVVDPNIRFQTMAGWEATAQSGHDVSPAFLSYRDELFDRVVDELGIDRLRIEVRSGSEYSNDTYAAFRAGQLDSNAWRAIRYSTINDNGDPFSLNMAGFSFTDLDNQVEKVLLPIRQRLEARGRRLQVNVDYVAFTGQISGGAYHHQNAEEYAEFVQATYTHLADRYGLVPDTWEVLLEPDNVSQWPPSYMRQAMVAAGNRLAAMGITPRFVAPSTTSMANAVTYADEIGRNGPPRFWAQLSYHRYAGVSREALQGIASRAQQWGLQTAMLEHIGSGYEDLHEDLKIGNNSSWSQFIIGFPGVPDDGSMYYTIDVGNPNAPLVRAASRTPFLRQYIRYIRTGAVRVSATTSEAAFDPVAFLNPDSKPVVVVKAERAGNLAVQGLAAGTYEATYTTSSSAGVRIGSFTVAAGELIRLSMPDRGVLTISGV